MFDAFRRDDDDESSTDQTEPAADGGVTDATDVPADQSLTGDPYQIDPVDSVHEYGVEIAVKVPSDDPEKEHDLIAGPQIRRILEDGYEDATASLWTGYDINARQGFTPTGIPFEDLFQHQVIVGTTGTGKTNEMLNEMVQLAYAGHGLVYFDPKAEDSRELLKKLPEHRLDDVIWIEPGDTVFDRSVAINFLDVPDCDSTDELDQVIEDRLQVVKAIFDNDDYWGPRMNAIVETMSRAMMKHNHAVEDSQQKYSIIDFYFILLLQERREAFAEEVDDPFLTEFLHQIAEMQDDEIRPVMTRVKSWVENGVMRRIAACRESSIDFQEVLDENKIVIVRTPITSDDAKQMITLGTMRPIWTAVQNNSFQGGTREPFFAFFDESDKVLNDNLDVDDMLARARSMKLSVTLACQYPNQLKEAGVLKPVLNNCNNMLAFRVMEDDDARPLMKRLRGYDVEDLVNAENYYIWTKVPVNDGGYSDPLKLKTFPPYPPLRSDEAVDEVIQASLERYGTEPLTDAEIQASLPFGHLTEALDEPLDELDIESEHCRNQALKAIYDQSIRADNPGGFVTVETVLDRLQRYLPGGEEITDDGKAWRSVFQKLPDAYLSHRTNDAGDREVRADDTSFMNIGESENDGKDEHWEQMADAYVPFTQLGFIFDIPAQTSKAMPDGLAVLDDVLALDGVTDPATITDRVMDYREEYPLLDWLAGVKDLYIESEHSTGATQPSQTVRNLVQAHTEGHRCLFLCREDVAQRVFNTVEREPFCCRSSHPVADERRFYTGTTTLSIEGETMTRPGASENVWVHDQQTGQYVLRDTDDTEHARFDTAAEIFTDASAYPDGGDRKIKRPVIPDYEFEDDLDDVEWDIIVVPEAPRDEDGQKERFSPEDLTLYREGQLNVPLTEILDDDIEQPTAIDDEADEKLTSSENDRGHKAATIDAAVSEFENGHRDSN